MDEYRTTLFQRAHEAQTKFDYFMCGLAGALAAYIAQTYEPQKLDNLFSLLQTASIALLAASVYCGIERILTANMITRLEHDELQATNSIHKLNADLEQDCAVFQNLTTGENNTRADLEKKRAALREKVLQLRASEDKEGPRAQFWAKMQLYLFLFGFLLIFAAKIWQPYQSDFSQL